MKKIKILYSGETTGAASGFGTYGHNILSRLVKNPRFHIAEFASFGSINDGKYANAKWRYYPNAVADGHPEKQLYESNQQNKYGAWRYERVLLDFKPDIVFTIRDPWMMEHEHKSPLRDFYHLAIMPTVDSAPQQHSWIEMFSGADAVFTYSDWAMPVLEKQSGGKIKPIASPYAGVEPDCFFPSKNKAYDKKKFGLPADSFIIGTVMRNQKRKLLEDLFHAFKIYLEKYGETEQGKKTYLLCHTSYPDFAGWDIPKLLKEYGIANKVYFTYYCKKTKNILIKKFSGARCFSPFTNDLTAAFPNVGCGASRKQLGDIYRTMDMYVQYAICFAENQEVKTKKGWVPIQDVEIGDECFTHKNQYRKVVDTYVNLPHTQNDRMLEVSMWSDYETLQVTENHSVFAYTSKEIPHDKSRSVREKIGDKLRDNISIPEFGKCKCKNLKAGDLVLCPIDDNVLDITEIKLDDYINKDRDIITDKYIKIKNGKTYNRFINVDDNFCKFMGLFAADGNCGKNNIKVTSHINELENQNLCKEIFDKLRPNNQQSIRKYKDRKAIDIFLNSMLHSKCFYEWFGKGEYKCLPEWTNHLPISKQHQILQGLFMGDGHYIKDKNISLYCTISKKLSDQIKDILRRSRINFNVRKVKKTGNRRDQYTFEVYGNIKQGEFITDRHNSKNFYHNNYHIIQIKCISQIAYNKNTYNIEVEGDHSLSVRACCAANCEGLSPGMPQIEAAACGIPLASVDYSAMADVVAKTKGIPVKVDRMFYEWETNAFRAYPDNTYLADSIFKYQNRDQEYKDNKSKQSLAAVEKHFSWDKSAQIWADHFESVVLTGKQGQWDAPTELTDTQIPQYDEHKHISNAQYIELLCMKVAKDPSLFSTYFGLSCIEQLNNGLTNAFKHGSPIDRKKMYDMFVVIGKNKILCEQVRLNPKMASPVDFIQFAHAFEKGLE